MEYIIIGILFILQLLSFYFIVMLNTKLAKYKGLEQKQQKLVEEMDNAIGVYLFEMKEENDRLIQELKLATEQSKVSTEPMQTTTNNSLSTAAPTMSDKKVAIVPKTVAASVYERNNESQTSVAPGKANEILKEISSIEKATQQPLTFEQKVKKMFDEGLTIEQIAKKTNKGTTEIELLLKFSF